MSGRLLNVFVLLCLNLLALGAAAQEAPPAPAPGKMDAVVATVNGEAIREGEVNAGLRDDAFGPDLETMKRSKLERLIQACILRQLLKAEKVSISKEEVEAELARMRETPPGAGCACCRYPTLEAFMEANAYDLRELRAQIANDLGMTKYLAAQWEREHPAGEARKKLAETERLGFEKEYLKASHIFFNVFQDPEFRLKPDAVREKAGRKAEAAWRRLQKGDKFETVAKETSEDALSAPKGGALGCVPAEIFGKPFADGVAALRPGEYGKPVESVWGFHIIRREPIGEEDLFSALKEEYLANHWEEARAKATQAAKVERPPAAKTP